MAIVMLSESNGKLNTHLLDRIKQLTGSVDTMAYIPSQPDPGLANFEKYVKNFTDELGIKHINAFGLEPEDWNESFIDEISKHKILMLPGGNTYRFAYWLRERKLREVIKDFAENKLIIAVSAGAIALTPRIDISRDDNESNITDYQGLSLVEFYFHPHFQQTQEQKVYIENFIAKLQTADKLALLAVTDESGIVINNGNIEKYGQVIEFT